MRYKNLIDGVYFSLTALQQRDGLLTCRAGGCWWWIPVAGPMVGGAVGAGVYFLFVELHQPEPEKQESKCSVQDKYEIMTMT